MKKIYHILIVITVLAFIPFSGFSQCKSFAKKVCKLELTPYIHDGNFNAAILTEGEDAELYKTFYAGQNYRIYICGSDALPEIEFQVLDVSRNVLYDNRKRDYSRIWDFKFCYPAVIKYLHSTLPNCIPCNILPSFNMPHKLISLSTSTEERTGNSGASNCGGFTG